MRELVSCHDDVIMCVTLLVTVCTAPKPASVLLSPQVPELARELGIQHVRGVLLYGPPGCGKTLIARTLARALKARPPKIIAAPELLDRWVGEAERCVSGSLLSFLFLSLPPSSLPPFLPPSLHDH